MKTCFKCGCQKPLAEFYAHPMMADGRLGKCIECAKADVRRNREQRRDYYNTYDSQRKKLKPVSPSPNHAKVKRAGDLLRRAIKAGDVTPWPVCALPECSKKPEAHHPDYGQPFSVVWLCRSHHQQAHAIKPSNEERT